MHLELTQRSKMRSYTFVKLEADVEPFLVPIERVRVFHDELADADEACTRAWLIAVLRLEVVEHLRQVTVRLDLTRVERDGLLVGQGSTYSRSAVTELEELGSSTSPVAFQSSAGVRTGISISWEPIASISCRMIVTILS